MVKIERTMPPPRSLEIEKEKKAGSYTCEDVIAQLAQDGHGKCYLCEINELQSIQVEHLRAHHGGKDKNRKFDWNNLFYSCAHCNNVKNQQKYDGLILDCCVVDPETVMNQVLQGGHVIVEPLDGSESVNLTAGLLTDCFELRNTGIRIRECDTRFKALQTTMTLLYKTLDKHRQNPTEKTRKQLEGMLSRAYKFAGFTRTYVRLHIERYPDLLPYVTLETTL